MGDRIFVESNELGQAAQATARIIASMQNVLQSIAGIQNKKANTWQGQAADRNASNFGELLKKLEAYLERANGTKEALDQAVAFYSEAENKQVQQVRQLATDGIF